MMWLVSILVWVLEGAFIGWIASKIMGNSMSMGMCFLVGIIGSMLGGFLASLLGISGGFIVSMLVAVAGACLLLWIAKKIAR